MTEQEPKKKNDIRETLQAAIAHLQHILPGQAPIKNFVHHNTLHGFQHLPFDEALSAARQVTGNYGYLPAESFRALYKKGRINRDDLCTILDKNQALKADELVYENSFSKIRQRDVYLAALCQPIKPITNSQLNWQIEESNALITFQQDVSTESRQRLLKTARQHHCENEAEAIFDLSNACLEKLDLKYYLLHPEDMLEMDASQSESRMNELSMQEDEKEDEQEDQGHALLHRLVRKEAERVLQQQLERVGPELTLRGFLHILTGDDILDDIRPVLIRHASAYLDQGMAAWHHTDRDKGFYHAWRQSAEHDQGWLFDNLDNWKQQLEILPDNSLDAIIRELQLMGLPRTRWADYLERLSLEIPGWSGMFCWHHNHADSDEVPVSGIDMTDYLAVRLVLERIFALRLSSQYWQLEPSLDSLRQYFRQHRSEFIVRYLSQANRLPEYLVTRAHRLIKQTQNLRTSYQEWILLANQMWNWRHSAMADRPTGYSVLHSGWCLFRLAQHLGLCGADIRALEKPQLEQLFHCLDQLDEERSGFIWLQAYEHHYCEQLYNAINKNKLRGRWQQRNKAPVAQLVFCMDDREESIRRHIEEINPGIETFGAAGFFGVAINWKGLDDDRVSALCPVVVTPCHEIQEISRASQQPQYHQHQKRRQQRLQLKNILLQESRRNLFASALLIILAAPFSLLALAGKILAPLGQNRLTQKWVNRFEPELDTDITLNTEQTDHSASPESPQLGFTDQEQADRVEKFLRSTGLTYHFSPFIILVGHGSSSQNNPHRAAYDCGACSGRHGGPNARVFAAMANREVIRQLLKERGIDIPDSSWFLGCEHNTGNDVISWYDLDSLPAARQTDFQQLQHEFNQASLRSAHERCRRFASAPRKIKPVKAFAHVNNRSMDISQARPELGHATNAAAIIGRRSITQGAFWDRRVFLISYNPSEDTTGKILETILLAVGPVGAGINLEYYFSTVNNDQYGCGSKITHNVAGLFGVMEGASSDLRTGLPLQMIEIHEAMRLRVIVEATPETLTAIYQRQPALQELIGNGWLLLTAMHPETGELYPFDPQAGFQPWQGQTQPLATVTHSSDWYSGHLDALPFALIEQEPNHG